MQKNDWNPPVFGYAGRSGEDLGAFFQKLTSRIRPAGSAQPSLDLCLFGKHPGWDDHMEDIGRQSRELLDFKRMLYVEGVGGNIDSGNWAHLPESERLARFNHLLIATRDDYCIMATLTASADGKGRNLYPIVAAVQARRLNLADLGRLVGPLLLDMREAVQKTSAAAEAQSIVSGYQGHLDALLPNLSPADARSNRLLTGHQAERLFSSDTAAARVIYALQRAVESIGHDASSARTETLRAPLDSQQPWFAARLWCALARSLVGPDKAVTAVEYRHETGITAAAIPSGFVDLIIGNPGSAALFGLRAGAARIPLVSDIPFELDESFKTQIRQYLAACRTAGDNLAPAFPAMA